MPKKNKTKTKAVKAVNASPAVRAAERSAPATASSEKGQHETRAARFKRLFRDPIFILFFVAAALTALYDIAFAVTAAVFFGSAGAGYIPENFMPLAITAMASNALTLGFALLYPKIRLK